MVRPSTFQKRVGRILDRAFICSQDTHGHTHIEREIDRER